MDSMDVEELRQTKMMCTVYLCFDVWHKNRIAPSTLQMCRLITSFSTWPDLQVCLFPSQSVNLRDSGDRQNAFLNISLLEFQLFLCLHQGAMLSKPTPFQAIEDWNAHVSALVMGSGCMSRLDWECPSSQLLNSATVINWLHAYR